jgi:hypothetical protein
MLPFLPFSLKNISDFTWRAGKAERKKIFCEMIYEFVPHIFIIALSFFAPRMQSRIDIEMGLSACRLGNIKMLLVF